jgi:hypothetical protein
MGRFQINRRGATAIECGFPTRHTNAPAIARFQSGKTPFGHWRDEIVSIEDGEIEKFLGDLNADGVQSKVFWAGAAISVAIKAGERIPTTTAQFGAENIGRHGDILSKERRFPNRYWRLYVPKMAREEIIAYWLCPAEPAKTQFASLIGDLAARFDAPSFEPHVTIYVTSAEREKPAAVLEKVLTECGPFRLVVRRLDYSERFTKTLFIQFAPNTPLARLTEDLRRASLSSSDYQLNPHLSLIYKEMNAETKRQLATSIALPLGEATFDTVKAIISPAEIRSRHEVEAWRVVAERRLTE